MRRLVLGRLADKTPDRPMSGLEPLPRSMADVETMMVLAHETQSRRPWDEAPLLAGEENPLRLAAVLDAWWTGGAEEAPRAVVGVDPVRSPQRWETAPRPGAGALLLLPEDSFPRGSEELEDELRRAWGSGTVATDLPDRLESSWCCWSAPRRRGSLQRACGRLAAEPALEGKLLAAWNVTGAMREDLPAGLLEEGRLAGFGLAVSSFVESRAVAERLDRTARGTGSGGCSRTTSGTASRAVPLVLLTSTRDGSGIFGGFGLLRASFCSSPLWYISITMSQPPTNLPSMKTCGVVGQFVKAVSAGLIAGSLKMLRTAKSTPRWSKTCITRWENPQAWRRSSHLWRR